MEGHLKPDCRIDMSGGQPMMPAAMTKRQLSKALELPRHELRCNYSTYLVAYTLTNALLQHASFKESAGGNATMSVAKTPPPFEIPIGSKTVSVKLIVPVNAGPALIAKLMAPSVPSVTHFESFPSFSFLLEHESGRKLVFDLGIRKDYNNYAPIIANYIPTTGYDIKVSKDVAEILHDNGIRSSDVEAVIWSHWHWDHIGNPATFPSSTELIVGRGFKEAFLPGYPSNPDSPILESDYTSRNLREITFDQGLNIGKFDAFDYFGDGSLYLLDSPGHAIGHLCGLARTTSNPDTFVLLGGDVCHHAGILRPSTFMPIPQSIVPNPLAPNTESGLCLGTAFEQLQKERGRDAQEPLFKPVFGHDISLAIETVHKLQEADVLDNIFVIIAHDWHIRDLVDHFPKSLNNWKEKGWAERAKWAFLGDFNAYWQSKGLC